MALQNLFLESVSAVTATKPAGLALGTVRWENNKRYVYVYNDGESPIYPGYAGVMTSGSGYSVTVTHSAGRGHAVGIVENTTFTTATYGWLLTEGVANFHATSACSQTGSTIFLSTDGGFAPASALTWGSTTVFPGVAGVTLAAVSAGASGLGRFKMLG